MSAMTERTVETSGGSTRVWEMGTGDPVGYFAGLHGLPAWLPLLDSLSAHRQVVVPSLPGYPGGYDYEPLDDVLDWILAARDVHAASGLGGADLIGASVGGALAAEIAAAWPDAVRRLVLIAPYGMYVDEEPSIDVFAQRQELLSSIISAKPDAYDSYVDTPDGEDEVEWDLTRFRAQMAAAKLLWPLGDTRLAKRLARITQPALIIWGADDQVLPPSYAQRFADAISGEASVCIIEGAGHKVEFDAPDAVADAIGEFLNET
ncbi:MAG: alpha/beta fold hydrolase [Rhodospirillaceae bacterium]|jgi:pimeloyl-ACP methyl ester carboxylesterase|nr:alpha/beta fold hydrolase [Rhodospirillaceae bacterium]MBT4115000.1 alpha/beta fold hydrolase [Rhodospirillaceae bacterium]MBT4671408.1 alpha/beta fold hydrolase [Rhodospirillaceae bacterium]MBT4721450.1 alpha/beta fold hydrolase [Rhodospirillaceae bacterium]MBT4750590.1 alpha/beta fold hydrolase [Rhodospirillaceae bacterium]